MGRWDASPLATPTSHVSLLHPMSKNLSKNLDFSEGYGLQPVHKPSRMSRALAPEGCSFIPSPTSFQSFWTGSQSRDMGHPYFLPVRHKRPRFSAPVMAHRRA